MKKIIMNESLLASQFTIGFEYEGFFKESKLPKNSSGSRTDDITAYLDKVFGFGSGKVVNDSSLHATKPDLLSFEYNSPAIQVTPQNLKQLADGLMKSRQKVETNQSCGFHTHFGCEHITKDDVKWLMFNIHINESLLNQISQLGSITFTSDRYASPTKNVDISKTVKSIHDDIKKEKRKPTEDDKINWKIEKYSTMNVHSQGTLEWRGPRRFLESKFIKSDDSINLYVRRIYKIILEMTKILDSKTYNGFDRDIIVKIINISNDFNSKAEKEKKNKPFRQKSKNKKEIDSETIQNYIKMVLEHNSLFVPIITNLFNPNKEFSNIADTELIHLKNITVEYFQRAFFTNGIGGEDIDDLNENKYFIVLRNTILKIDNKSIDNFYSNLFENMNNEQALRYVLILLYVYLSTNQQPPNIIVDIFTELLTDCKDVYIRLDQLKKLFTIINLYQHSVVLIPYIKQFLKNNRVDTESIISLLNNNENLPQQTKNILYSFFADGKNLEYIKYLKEIPNYIQKRLVKNNPYNIQYISNPIPDVIGYVKKKLPNYEKFLKGF